MTEPSAETATPQVKFTGGRRRGVFAQRRFGPGEVVEWVPVLLIPAEQRDLVVQTDLVHFLCEWPLRGSEVALPFGFGAMYKYSSEPNAVVHKRLENMSMDIVALREIHVGEEVVIDGPSLAPVRARR